MIGFLKKKKPARVPARNTDPKEVNANKAIDQHFKYLQAIRDTKDPGKKQALSELQASISKEAMQAMKVVHDFSERRSRQIHQEHGGKHKSHPFTAPTHTGYTNMAILLEKEKNYPEAIRISRHAKSEGWNGDWDKRIARCESKLAKLS